MDSPPRKRRPHDARAQSNGNGVSDDMKQCSACRKHLVPGVNYDDHPWLYGLACSDCLLLCKSTSAKWVTNSFKCEDCGQADEPTRPFQDRMLCIACCTLLEEIPRPHRHDWKLKVLQLHVDSIHSSERKPLRVLSLFDGLGTGLLGLDNNKLEVQKYFSCEVDEAAMNILDFRFHGRIHHLGDVSNLTFEKLSSLGEIDLLIGGSPCNEFSRANPKRAGLFDPSKSGTLFFDFHRVLSFLQAKSAKTGRPLFWLYENVASMPTNIKETMSRYLRCQPAIWDAVYFLPAKRARLFWGNIPELHRGPKLERPHVTLTTILEPYRHALVETLPTITTTFHSQTLGKGMQLPVIQDGQESGLLITERERLFGFPTHFTDGPNLSITQRQCLLGRAWSVPVIERIFFPLTRLFKIKEEGMSVE